MSKPVTIMFDDDLYKKLRALQSKEIRKTYRSVSFSKILNDVIRKDLLKN